MGSHKKKKYESDSSNDSSDSSSDDERKKKSSKKHRHSSEDESDKDSKTKKAKYSGSSDESSHDKSRNKRTQRSTESRKSNQKNDKIDSYRSRHRDDRYKRFERNDRSRDDRTGSSRDRERYDRSRNRRYDDNRRRNDKSRFDHANAKWGKPEDDNSKDKAKNQDKEKPNFGLSGKLTEETNTYKGIVIKYSEPPEARKPRRRWRLYPFKGEKALQTLYIHRESAYLIGRERKVVDLPVDHPSCSKQHAALQYRLVPFTRDDGTVGKRVRPYLIDLDSANGTFINNKKIEPRKYYELMEKDVIKFGFSSREYVLLHENSKDEALDDDVKVEEEEEGEVKVKKEK